mgnify:CR=1 FL=1
MSLAHMFYAKQAFRRAGEEVERMRACAPDDGGAGTLCETQRHRGVGHRHCQIGHEISQFSRRGCLPWLGRSEPQRPDGRRQPPLMRV